MQSDIPPEICCKVLAYAYPSLSSRIAEMAAVFRLRRVSRYTKEVIEQCFLTQFRRLAHGVNCLFTSDSYAISSREISGKVLASLSNLERLKLLCNTRVTDADLVGLTRLRKLALVNTLGIRGSCFHALENLTSLDLSFNSCIKDNAICELTQLQQLVLHNNSLITDSGISNLTRLHTLELYHCQALTSKALEGMSSLTCLHLTGRSIINDAQLSRLPCLPKLETLSVAYNGELSHWQSIRQASSLKTLYVTPVALLSPACLLLEQEVVGRGITVMKLFPM